MMALGVDWDQAKAQRMRAEREGKGRTESTEVGKELGAVPKQLQAARDHVFLAVCKHDVHEVEKVRVGRWHGQLPVELAQHLELKAHDVLLRHPALRQRAQVLERWRPCLDKLGGDEEASERDELDPALRCVDRAAEVAVVVVDRRPRRLSRKPVVFADLPMMRKAGRERGCMPDDQRGAGVIQSEYAR